MKVSSDHDTRGAFKKIFWSMSRRIKNGARCIFGGRRGPACQNEEGARGGEELGKEVIGHQAVRFEYSYIGAKGREANVATSATALAVEQDLGARWSVKVRRSGTGVRFVCACDVRMCLHRMCSLLTSNDVC